MSLYTEKTLDDIQSNGKQLIEINQELLAVNEAILGKLQEINGTLSKIYLSNYKEKPNSCSND